MNQSDKKNFEFIKNSGVNYFCRIPPRNWFENTKIRQKKKFSMKMKTK